MFSIAILALTGDPPRRGEPVKAISIKSGMVSSSLSWSCSAVPRPSYRRWFSSRKKVDSAARKLLHGHLFSALVYGHLTESLWKVRRKPSASGVGRVFGGREEAVRWIRQQMAQGRKG